MSKKPEITILIAVTLLFLGVMTGVLIGRQSSKSEIHLLTSESTVSEQAPEESKESNHSGKLNINIATEKELTMLPGIGSAYAKRIIEYRETQGPFATINDLMNVSGIGKQRFDAIENYITVGG